MELLLVYVLNPSSRKATLKELPHVNSVFLALRRNILSINLIDKQNLLVRLQRFQVRRFKRLSSDLQVIMIDESPLFDKSVKSLS